LVKNKEEYTFNELKKWLNSLPKTRLNEVAVIAGEQTFTPIELMEAVKDKKNPYGRMLVSMFNNYKIEIEKKQKKSEKERKL